MVKGRQFSPHTHNSQIHKAAARLGTVILGSAHQLRTQACPLELRIDRQQAQVRPVAPEFNENATPHHALVLSNFLSSFLSNFLSNQEHPDSKQSPHLIRVDSIAVDQEALGLPKRCVDHGSDRFRILNVRYS